MSSIRERSRPNWARSSVLRHDACGQNSTSTGIADSRIIVRSLCDPLATLRQLTAPVGKGIDQVKARSALATLLHLAGHDALDVNRCPCETSLGPAEFERPGRKQGHSPQTQTAYERTLARLVKHGVDCSSIERAARVVRPNLPLCHEDFQNRPVAVVDFHALRLISRSPWTICRQPLAHSVATEHIHFLRGVLAIAG